MNLVIDIGNTLVKLSSFRNGEEVRHEKFDEFNFDVFKKYLTTSEKIDAAIISASGALTEDLEEELETREIPYINFEFGVPVPISINYDTPETLGMDRLAGVLGAFTEFPEQNCLVIDLGTAITYDIITSEGFYEGGNISPGLQLRFDCLNKHTSKLPRLMPESNEINHGRNTHDAIKAGVHNGILYELEGQINYFKNIYDDLRIILTGGDARYFEKRLKKPIFVVSNLVRKGLNFILEYNVKQISNT